MKVALIGGGSRSALAFLRLRAATAPDLEFVSIVRNATAAADPARTIVVPEYSAITADQLAGCDAVINFVGTAAAPDESEYLRVNAAFALHFAEAARAAGARHFIHLSSLSVYGRAQGADQHTKVGPSSAYGRSKLEAERLLAPLDDPDFVVTLLRIPAIYGAGSPSKLSLLARLWRLARILPAPRPLPRRSIIWDSNLAQILLALLRTPRSGVVFAADPEPFTLEDLRKALPFRAWLVQVPPLLFAPIRLAAPSLHASLFAPMEIAPECLFQPTDPPLTPTRQALEAAFRDPDQRNAR